MRHIRLEGPIITVALINSAAGDYSLRVLDGEAFLEDIQNMVYFEDTRFWGSPDNVIVEDIETCKVGCVEEKN